MELGRVRAVVALASAAAEAVLSPEQDQAASRLLAAQEEVVAALRTLIEADPVAAATLAGQLSTFWQDAGRIQEGRELTSAAIAAAQAVHGHGLDHPPALLAAADLAFRAGDQAEATRLARAAIAAATTAGDARTAGLAWLDLSRVAFRDGDAAGIEAAAREAERSAPEDGLVRRGVVHMLAWAAHTGGDLDLARQRFEESLELRRRHGSRIGIASELANLGDMALDSGDHGGAAAALVEAFEIAVDLGSAYMVVNTLPSLAGLVAPTDAELGARLFGAADMAAQTAGLMPDPGSDRADLRAALRERLGDARYETLLAKGAALSFAEVVALVRAWEPPPG